MARGRSVPAQRRLARPWPLSAPPLALHPVPPFASVSRHRRHGRPRPAPGRGGESRASASSISAAARSRARRTCSGVIAPRPGAGPRIARSDRGRARSPGLPGDIGEVVVLGVPFHPIRLGYDQGRSASLCARVAAALVAAWTSSRSFPSTARRPRVGIRPREEIGLRGLLLHRRRVGQRLFSRITMTPNRCAAARLSLHGSRRWKRRRLRSRSGPRAFLRAGESQGGPAANGNQRASMLMGARTPYSRDPRWVLPSRPPVGPVARAR